MLNSVDIHISMHINVLRHNCIDENPRNHSILGLLTAVV